MKDWHSLKMSRVFSILKSSKKGLTDRQVKVRQKRHGKNELPKARPLSSLVIMISQLKSPLVYVLLIASIISLVLGHLSDAWIIMFVVLINTVFGYYQEKKANRAMQKLKEIVRQEAKVLRHGREIKIDASELVPGDIIYLEAGDKAPADARLFSANNLQTIEAPLTGESMPSKKSYRVLDNGTAMADRENIVYMGTLISRGQGMAVVVATGQDTEIGKISRLIKDAKEDQTPLQEKLSQFSRWLTFFILIICSIIFSIGLLAGRDPVEMFIIVVALAVAAIPEGLLVAVTIILTIGMQFILKKKALVKKLIAAETLGSTSIICTDKTGTLTEGKMRVSKIVTLDDEYEISKIDESSQPEKVQDLILKISTLCTSAVIENPDAELEKMRIIGTPTEKSLILAAIQSGFNKEELNKEYIELAQIPFDSEKKYMATLHGHKKQNHNHVFVKGAPEVVFGFCNRFLKGNKKIKLTLKDFKELKRKYESLTKKGLRLLAFAYKTGNFESLDDEINDLVFLGFIALKDPLRPDTKKTMELSYQAGIRPIIITGDHRLTAKAIFEELGLKVKGNIVEGKDLDKWTDEQLKEKVKDIDIYARVEPRHKLRVVDAWQARGEVVAMTGDGINDAPALKSADIGIALGSGSDVTKETADIVLLDNNFKVIVAIIERGRIIFDNIRKVILYLLSDSFSEIILIAGSLIMGLPLPILATQILWINLAADGLPNIAMAFEPGEKEIMNEPPRKRNESILNKEMKILIFIIGIITDIVLLALFVVLLKMDLNLNYIRTIIFAALGLDSLFYVFSIRSLRHSIFTKNPFSNKYLLGAVVIAFLILISIIYVPWLENIFHTTHLGFREWILIIGLAIFKIFLIEIVKHYFIVKKNQFKKLHVTRNFA